MILSDASKKIAKILSIVKRIPRGRVASYGQVGSLAGLPDHARYVGWVLKGLPKNTSIPWHRVLNRQGHIPVQGREYEAIEQSRRLKREGIVFDHDGNLPMREYRWDPIGD